ncbi:hypothetical protein ARMA_0632 [Ardenticatena maritima]|uniref:Regulator n=1 Tax=Ardenticatena maritima TaxID=872965 RepID=A0A0M8K7S4_9CHLR|nr:hypothetical protein [Ardenticatena maritima]KPL89699.1 regulator [Ardenticatena maritima]GAP62209.1 hypothetical protein ARMA_0632 [Ardenticatena maritima]
MVVVQPNQPERDVDARAWAVFTKAIELVGGPRGLIEHRRLTWLPSLMEAAYAVVLREEAHKSVDEIAAFLGLSTQAVRLMLQASTDAVLERLQGEGEEDSHRTHVAGGLAKLAYQALLREAPETP